jgi:hypothetical protein
VRRSLSKNGQHETRQGRERLREQFENDPDFYERIKAVYEDGIVAVTTCPSCRDRALPDHRTRIAAGDSFLAQVYGKPKQNVESKHEHTITVVSRLGEALARADSEARENAEAALKEQAALPAPDVIEYSELEPPTANGAGEL